MNFGMRSIYIQVVKYNRVPELVRRTFKYIYSTPYETKQYRAVARLLNKWLVKNVTKTK